MEELLQLLLEVAESEERSTWYGEGSDVKSESLHALMDVLEQAQRRLTQEK